MKNKQLTKEDSDELCKLFEAIKVQVDQDIDSKGGPSKFDALSGSFAFDGA